MVTHEVNLLVVRVVVNDRFLYVQVTWPFSRTVRRQLAATLVFVHTRSLLHVRRARFMSHQHQ